MGKNDQHQSTHEELAQLVVKMQGHPDLVHVQDRFQQQLGGGAEPWTLLDTRLLADGTALPSEAMGARMKLAVGSYLTVVGALLLGAMPWAWSTASRVVEGQQTSARFLWLTITPTPEFCAVLIVILMSLVGCFAVLALTFASRAGHGTLEASYLWWYVTRPMSAAGIGLLCYLAVAAGLLTTNGAGDTSSLVLAAAIGGLAGLFTDQVLKKLRGALGITATSTWGSAARDD